MGLKEGWLFMLAVVMVAALVIFWSDVTLWLPNLTFGVDRQFTMSSQKSDGFVITAGRRADPTQNIHPSDTGPSASRWSLGIFAGSALVFALALWLVRSQMTVDDLSYMKAMIPHHSIAIMTSARANISDQPETCRPDYREPAPGNPGDENVDRRT